MYVRVCACVCACVWVLVYAFVCVWSEFRSFTVHKTLPYTIDMCTHSVFRGNISYAKTPIMFWWDQNDYRPQKAAVIIDM